MRPSRSNRARGCQVALFLCCHLNVQALITNNLVADWRADAGLTSGSGGRLSQWTDQHQSINNDGLGPHQLTQANSTFQPTALTDAHGYRGVMFPWGADNSHPKTFLTIGSSLGSFDTANTTVYIASTGPYAQENQTLIGFGGATSGWLKFYQNGTSPAAMLVGTQLSTTIYPPLNRAVFVASGNTNFTTLRWNNLTQTNPPQNRITTTSGGAIASFNSSEYYSGIVYRILIYKAAHTPAQMDQQVAELASLYGVLTNYTKQVVCRGASTTAGQNSTMLQGYPFQLWERYPEILWHGQGLGNPVNGQTGMIGTNGLAASMYAIDTNYVDSLYDPALQQNNLFVIAGINDMITGNLNGQATYQRLTNYIAARKTARPWRITVSTIQSDAPQPSTNADYNLRIRLNPGGWDRLVDPGVGSPIETRLSNPFDPKYFGSDGIHLNNLGYSVLVDHFSQSINVPRRTTGFFGP